jgi:hypothetical protein
VMVILDTDHLKQSSSAKASRAIQYFPLDSVTYPQPILVAGGLRVSTRLSYKNCSSADSRNSSDLN